MVELHMVRQPVPFVGSGEASVVESRDSAYCEHCVRWVVFRAIRDVHRIARSESDSRVIGGLLAELPALEQIIFESCEATTGSDTHWISHWPPVLLGKVTHLNSLAVKSKTIACYSLLPF